MGTWVLGRNAGDHNCEDDPGRCNIQWNGTNASLEDWSKFRRLNRWNLVNDALRECLVAECL